MEIAHLLPCGQHLVPFIQNGLAANQDNVLETELSVGGSVQWKLLSHKIIATHKLHDEHSVE